MMLFTVRHKHDVSAVENKTRGVELNWDRQIATNRRARYKRWYMRSRVCL